MRRELLVIAKQRWRAPEADHTRTYGLRTLERWYSAYRKGGLEALRPEPRSDRGRAQALTAEQRELLLDIRREYPFATVPTILRRRARRPWRDLRDDCAAALRRARPRPDPAA